MTTKHYHSGDPLGVNNGINWDEQPLGHVPDIEIARRLNVAENAVRMQRVKRGILAYYAARRNLFEEYAKEREIQMDYEITWDYVAGFFDGEGYVAGSKSMSKGREYTNVRIAFVNTHREVLEKIKTFLGIGIMACQNPSNKPKLVKSNKPCYALRINGRKILPILEQLSKRCHVKKPEIDYVINYIKNIIETETRGRLPYSHHTEWLHEKMGFTKEQIAEMYNSTRISVASCLERAKKKRELQ